MKVETPLGLAKNREGSMHKEPRRRQIFENRMTDLMEIEQVAAELGKAPKTIRNWIAKRLIPYVRVGNKNMVKRKSLEAWLNQKEVKPWV